MPRRTSRSTPSSDADERSSSRGRAFWAQVALALVASGSLGSIGGAYVTAEQTGSVATAEQAFRQQQAIDAVQCDDVERDAVEDITADTRDRPDFWTSVVFGEEIDDYSSETERAACPTLRVDILDRLEDLPAPR